MRQDAFLKIAGRKNQSTSPRERREANMNRRNKPLKPRHASGVNSQFRGRIAKRAVVNRSVRHAHLNQGLRPSRSARMRVIIDAPRYNDLRGGRLGFGPDFLWRASAIVYNQ